MEKKNRKLIIDGNAFYEIDMNCVEQKKKQKKQEKKQPKKQRRYK